MPLNIDPDSVDLTKLTRNQTNQLFQSVVEEIQTNSGLDFMKSWNRAKALYPALAAAMTARNGVAENIVSAVNIPVPKKPLPLPIATDQNTFNLGLPRDVSPEIFALAWKANGGKAVPLDAGKVFDAMVDMLQKQNKGSADDAAASAAAQFPRLLQLKQAQAGAQQFAKTLPSTSIPTSVAVSMPMPIAATPTDHSLALSGPTAAAKKNMGLSVLGNESTAFIVESDPFPIHISFVKNP